MEKSKLEQANDLLLKMDYCNSALGYLGENHPWKMEVVFRWEGGMRCFTLPSSLVPQIKSAYEKDLANYQKQFEDL